MYCSVPNRGACTFINLEKKFPPTRPYFVLHVYCFWEKNPPARSFSYMCIGICPARLLILRKNSPLHGLIFVCTFIDFEIKRSPYTSILSYVNGLILVCTFIDFEKKIPPARLFPPTFRRYNTKYLLKWQTKLNLQAIYI